MKDHSIIISDADLLESRKIREKIVNKAIMEYARLNNLSISQVEKKKRMEERKGILYFYYDKELVVSISLYCYYQWPSFRIKYSLHDILPVLSV